MHYLYNCAETNKITSKSLLPNKKLKPWSKDFFSKFDIQDNLITAYSSVSTIDSFITLLHNIETSFRFFNRNNTSNAYNKMVHLYQSEKRTVSFSRFFLQICRRYRLFFATFMKQNSWYRSCLRCSEASSLLHSSAGLLWATVFLCILHIPQTLCTNLCSKRLVRQKVKLMGSLDSERERNLLPWIIPYKQNIALIINIDKLPTRALRASEQSF